MIDQPPKDLDDSTLSEEEKRRLQFQRRMKFISNLRLPGRNAWLVGWAIALMTALIILLRLYATQALTDFWGVAFVPIGLVFYLNILFSGLSVMKRLAETRMEKEAASVQAVRKSEQLQEDLQDNFFTNLVKINFKYIDQYYLQTQLQADKSFLLCMIASLVSLTIIVSGILMLFFGHTSNNNQAGYVATASGTLSEFIAAVFFYLYNRTITKMGEYHQKLVLTQNISLALKITEELPVPEQVTARMSLVTYLSADINRFLTTSAQTGAK